MPNVQNDTAAAAAPGGPAKEIQVDAPLLTHKSERRTDPAAAPVIRSERNTSAAAKKEFCDCWLSFGKSGSGWRGFFEPVPRRPSRAGNLLQSMLSGGSSDKDGDASSSASMKQEIGRRKAHQWIEALRARRLFWIGVPDSKFGFWLKVGL